MQASYIMFVNNRVERKSYDFVQRDAHSSARRITRE